ncbi:Zonadhesin [Armadillidium nasatum]|uniref:Zonadhesin n=1 Tax=Armadillidium nasatum TaxID=96803 RepID=A0A5N5THC2_9CRUS|nr:Zonadhesin [Armadillidium nasatum]
MVRAKGLSNRSNSLFKKFDNSNCKCIPKNYPCVRRGFRINFNFGRLILGDCEKVEHPVYKISRYNILKLPSACVPNLFLCCDEGKTAFVASKGGSSNKINYIFKGSPRSASEKKITNNKKKQDLPNVAQNTVVPSLMKYFSKTVLSKTENSDRNFKISSNHLATTPLTKTPENASRNPPIGKEFEINHQSDASPISPSNKYSNFTNLFKVFIKSTATTGNTSNSRFSDRENSHFINLPVTDTSSKVTANKPNFPKYNFSSLDPATSVNNIHPKGKDYLNIDSLQRKNVSTIATNRDTESIPYRDIMHKVTLQNNTRTKNRLHNYDEPSNSNNLAMNHITRKTNFKKLIKHADISTAIPYVHPETKVSKPSVQIEAEVKFPKVTLLTEAMTASEEPLAKEYRIPKLVLIPSLTSLAEVANSNYKPLTEVTMPSTTMAEEETMLSTSLIIELPTTTMGEDVTMPNTTTMGEDVTMPSTTTMGEDVTMPNTTTMGEDVTMPNTTTMGEDVTIPNTTTMSEDVTITMPSTTTMGEEVTMPNTTTMGEEVTMPNTTTMGEEVTMPTMSLTEDFTMPSTTLFEVTMSSTELMAEEATVSNITQIDEDKNKISDDIDHTKEQAKEEKFSTKLSKYVVHPRSKGSADLIPVFNESVDKLISFSKKLQMPPHISKNMPNSSFHTTDANLLEIMEEMSQKEGTNELDSSNTMSLNNLQTKLNLPKDVHEAKKNYISNGMTETTTYYEDTTVPQIEQKQRNPIFKWLLNIF